MKRDKYIFDPLALEQMVTTEPRVILLDKNLASRIPRRMVYARIASGPVMEVGTIRREE
jgi:hypothetical protein